MEPPPPYPAHPLDPNQYFASPQPLSRYLPLDSHPQLPAPFPVYQQLQPTQVHPLEALYQQQPQHPQLPEPFPTHQAPFDHPLNNLEFTSQPLPYPPSQIPPQQVLQPPPTSPNTPSPPSSPPTATPSAHNNKQSQSTFKWLQGNFQFRSHVSISRSTIYELYQKFCHQNGFVAVCKATFGKIIRIKFPKVKSKRLGARGQSKYHYYNITFKDERKRVSMLLSPSPEHLSDQNASNNPNVNSGPVSSGFGSFIPLPASSSTQYTSQWDSQLQQQPVLTQLGPWNGEPLGSQTAIIHQNPPGYLSSPPEPSSHQLTLFSNRTTSLETYSHFNLNESDYHAIIQSMLSYMRIPANQQPLTNTKFVFINLYKIHCQCLIDSALSGNYAQMRHYLMHFWQQLPRHVTIYLSSMARLDSHMYSLLEDIYLANHDTTSLDNCRRLHTIATLIPVWLRKTFEYLPLEAEWWTLVGPEGHAQHQMNVGQIKVAEAERWRWRIKFKVDFIVALKKLTLASLRHSLSSLLHAFDRLFEVTPTAYYDLDASQGYQTHLIHQQLYTNAYRPSHSLLFSQTQTHLWNTLLGQFRLLLARLLEVSTSSESVSSTETPKGESYPLAGQRIIDELDQMIASIETIRNGRNCAQSFAGQSEGNAPSAQQCRFYADLTLLFVRLFDHLFGWFTVEAILTHQEGELVDVWLDEEDEDEEEDESELLYNSVESNQILEMQNPQTVSQVYLLLTTIQAYLMEVCQTAQRKCRFGGSPGEETIDF